MSETQKTSNPRKKTTSTSSNVSKKEFDAMKKQTNELTKQIEELTKALLQKESAPLVVQQATQSGIDLDEDIDVISLCNNKLNLATGGFGRGNIHYFEYFGEVKPIPFRDLKEILSNPDGRGFLQKGYYQVLDQRARKALRISKLHDDLPDAQDLITLFDKDLPTIKITLERMTPYQRDVISRVAIDKLFDGEEVDMNIIKAIGDSVSKDLVTIANDRKGLTTGGGD